MPTVTKKTIVTETHAARADHVVQTLTGLARSKIRGLFDHDAVKINSLVCNADFSRVQAGDVIEVTYDPHNLPREKPKIWKDSSFRIIHEDADLLVVDKAAWILTVAEDDTEEDPLNRTKTLVDAIKNYLQKRQGRMAMLYLVQRLDRGTSGLLVIAKTSVAAKNLQNQFASHQPQREYLAVVAGTMADDAGKFESYLATKPDLSRYSTQRHEQGEIAITHYRIEKRLPGLTLVRCRLETGRRNQIRVHFAEAGHPVLGDPRYRRDLAKHSLWPYKRLALHAAMLGFIHPITGQPMQFISPMPLEFSKLQGALQALSKTGRLHSVVPDRKNDKLHFPSFSGRSDARSGVHASSRPKLKKYEQTNDKKSRSRPRRSNKK